MSRYSRILEKANLDQELFGGDPTPVDVPEFPPAVEPDPTPVSAPAEVSARVETDSSHDALAEDSSTSIVDLHDAPEPETNNDDSWRLELGRLLGLDSIPVAARLGMCPLGSMKSAAECAAALGLWIAARSSSPVLLVEASFDAPRLARLFRSRRLGLAEAMAANEPRWDHFVHDTMYPGLKVLPAGRNPKLKQLLNEQDSFCRTLAKLSESFENVIVILPNPRVGGFDRLAVSQAADIIFPVIEPGKVTASQAGRAIGRLASGSARVAAALVAPHHVIGDAARMEHIAKQLSDAPRGDHA